MSIEIIIDGYNLINAWTDLKIKFKNSPDIARNELIEILSNYRKIKQHKITVVFDAYNNYNLFTSSFSEKGITIIYTPSGVTADDYIKKLIKDKGSRYIVISSDNEIKNFSSSHNATPVNSEEFIEKLQFSFYFNAKGIMKEEETIEKTLSTKKKGNPKRLPKKLRKIQHKVKKL